MHKVKVPLWLNIYLEQFKKYFNFLKKYLPWIVLIYSLTLLCVAFLIFYEQQKIFYHFSEVFFTAKDVLIYAKLLSSYSIIKWFIFSANILIVVLWGFISYLFYLLFRLSIEWIYQMYYKSSKYFIVLRIRFNRLFLVTIGKRLNISIVVILSLVMLIFIKLNIFEKNLPKLIDFFVITICILIPIVYSFTWYQYLSIRNRRKKVRKKNYLDEYLFSKQIIRHRFKNVIIGIIFLALFGWALLPILFGQLELIENEGFKFLSDNGEYEINWQWMHNKGYFSNNTNRTSFLDLPSPNNLKKSLSWLRNAGGLENYEELKKHFSYFQKKMFFVLTLIILCEIGIPSVINGLIYKEKRKVLLTVLFATVKSTLLVVFLQIFIRKAYFIDISNAMGAGAIFMFAISFFLMQESIELGNKIR